jgi:hypothetical protein
MKEIPGKSITGGHDPKNFPPNETLFINIMIYMNWHISLDMLAILFYLL